MVDALGLSEYWNNYPNYGISAETVWEKVGGGLYWLHVTQTNEYYNTCALRVSIALVNSGKTISAGQGRTVNNNFKAIRDVTYNGRSIKKDTLFEAEKPGSRYVISASHVSALLTQVLGKKPIKWSSMAEAEGLRDCIVKENREAFFVAVGHAGMIKKDYLDPYFPYTATGEIWLTE